MQTPSLILRFLLGFRLPNPRAVSVIKKDSDVRPLVGPYISRRWHSRTSICDGIDYISGRAFPPPALDSPIVLQGLQCSKTISATFTYYLFLRTMDIPWHRRILVGTRPRSPIQRAHAAGIRTRGPVNHSPRAPSRWESAQRMSDEWFVPPGNVRDAVIVASLRS